MLCLLVSKFILKLIVILFCFQSKAEEMIWNLLDMCLCIFSGEGSTHNQVTPPFFINLSHTLTSFLFFSLPWQGLKAGTKKQKYDKISEKKMLTPIEVSLFFF